MSEMTSKKMSLEDIREAGELIGKGAISNRIGYYIKQLEGKNYTDSVDLLARISVLLKAASYDELFNSVCEEAELQEEEFLSYALSREYNE